MQSRPQEVVDWGHDRDSIPSITDVQEFHEKWITWWGNCQPKWRLTQAWPFSCENAKGKDWARLNVTGPHGLFAVVMSTSWWAVSTDLDPRCRAVFDAAITDLLWVIGNLTRFNSGSQATGPEPKTVAAAHFPGHGERGPGKRKIKPSSKVISKS